MTGFVGQIANMAKSLAPLLKIIRNYEKSRKTRGGFMSKKLFLLALLLTKTALAVGPTVECRFAALTEDEHVALDEIVAYTLNPASGISGDFDPYGFELSVVGNQLAVAIYVNDEPVSGIQIPIRNVINLPLGASVFGVNTVYHEPVQGFVSVQYECLKVLW